MTDTQDKRDIELEYYREKLAELANDATKLSYFRRWADHVLAVGESITGPGVDMTEAERKFAEDMLASYYASYNETASE